MFFFLVEINYGPLGAGGGDAELLKRVRAAAHTGLSELRDCAGFNQVNTEYSTLLCRAHLSTSTYRVTIRASSGSAAAHLSAYSSNMESAGSSPGLHS